MNAEPGGSIEVVPYDRGWPAAFNRLRAMYQEALRAVPIVGIEHVGARRCHRVEVIERRRQADVGRAPPDLPRTNTYVVIDGSLPLLNYLGVRDVLRSDAALHDAYSALKLALAEESADMASYVEGKSPLPLASHLAISEGLIKPHVVFGVWVALAVLVATERPDPHVDADCVGRVLDGG